MISLHSQAVAFIIKMIAEDWMNVRVDSERDVKMRQARASRLIIICGYAIRVLRDYRSPYILSYTLDT